MAFEEEPDKYYKKFDFFYKRTCFRLMVEFYKLLFAPYHKKWVDQRKKGDMGNYMLSFATFYFSSLIEKLPKQYQEQFIAGLTVIVNSHRHNKEDQFIRNSMFSFDTVRDTMYKYSKKS
mmetsp:Transcript_1970/g.1426  ORF Transcript_1970/g.1426 Transcript_1970/m.1426 type:complete len:119 (+) Transcript_1970:883-1239(+)